MINNYLDKIIKCRDFLINENIKKENILGIFKLKTFENGYAAIYIPTFEELCLKEDKAEKYILQNEITLFVQDIRYYDYCNAVDLSSNGWINPKYEKLWEKFLKSLDMLECNNVKVNIIKNSVMSTKEEIKLDDFLNKITHAEKRALSAIGEKIKSEGYISVTIITKETSISRPVYTNLFRKLKEYNMADVSNKGVKGTYIKFINPELIYAIEKKIL